MRELFATSVISLLLTPILFVGLYVTFAQTTQSTSYRVISSSVNFGGGRSTSTTQSLESTGGEIATGVSQSTNYTLKAGYQQMQEVFIALTGGNSLTLSPPISGITGGTSNGSTTVTVTTDSPSGYSLTIVSSQSPTMQSGLNTIADYVPQGASADYTFLTGSTDAHFGFSPSGVDIVSRYKNNGSSCGSGSTITAKACWDGVSTTTRVIASSAVANNPSGATTTVFYRVGVGTSVALAPGFYIATTTLTALPQ